MADQPEPARLRVTNPAQVAEIIPYLVGFTPEQSLVVVVSQHGQVQVTARVDLDDIQPAGAVEDLLDRLWARFPDSTATAIAYTADQPAGWNLLQRCDNWLPNGCQTMLVDADRWHLADGTTGPIDHYGTVAAQATYQGLQHLTSRAELAARFASGPDTDQLHQRYRDTFATVPNPGDITGILTLTRGLIERNLPADSTAAAASPSMAEPDAMQLAVLAQHPAARDLALLSMNHANASNHLRLWQNVLHATPAARSDMALYLAGMAAWISGDGASATIALEQAINVAGPSARPHPTRLLDGLIDQVVPPSAWETLRETLLEDTKPDVRAALSGKEPDLARRSGWPPAHASARINPSEVVEPNPTRGIDLGR